MKTVAIWLIGLLTLAYAQSEVPAGTEILWDSWGVPHIFAQTEEGAFYAYGWAQAKSHGSLILTLYAQARGRAAEYFGERYLDSDRGARLMRAPERAQVWFEAQSPQFRRNLEAFAAGFNAYAEAHTDALAEEARAVLPISAIDVLAHTVRDLSIFISASSECVNALPGLEMVASAGSNGWAIAPSRSASGNALLLANPHLPWHGLMIFYEAQLEAPGYSAYGAALVGLPVPVIVFNDNLGWTHTVNTLDGCDLYALTLEGEGYRFDGEVKPFEVDTQVIKVKGADGILEEVPFEIRRSAHGPIVTEGNGTAIAMRMVGVDAGDYPGLLEQWWDMAKAENVEAFQRVLRRNQLPMFNVIYADADGSVMLHFAGRVPVRPSGDSAFWTTPVPGDTSQLLWTEVHPYEDLPKVINPEDGWVQNSNSPPWFMTGTGAPKPEDFPAYMSPPGPVNIREQRGLSMLMGDDSISFDELVAYKHDTLSELAERVLADLVAAARDSGSDLAKDAAGVLERWDRHSKAGSQGALLFTLWFVNYMGASFQRAMQADPTFVPSFATIHGEALFSTPWQAEDPVNTPTGLADPQLAVAALEQAAQAVSAMGPLDQPWGETVRMRVGEVDVPASGGLGLIGTFRVIEAAPGRDGRFQTVGGDTYVAVVEFSSPVKAMVLTTYGNSSEPGSPYLGDQLELATRQALRPAWRTREEIEAHLQDRTVW